MLDNTIVTGRAVVPWMYSGTTKKPKGGVFKTRKDIKVRDPCLLMNAGAFVEFPNLFFSPL